jgi:transcription elongation factor Elf1
MLFEDLKCLRCGNEIFEEIDCGFDSYDNDISYSSYKCKNCGLWFDGWMKKWFIDVDFWQEIESAKEYK